MRRQFIFALFGIFVIATIAVISLDHKGESISSKPNAGFTSTCPHDKELSTYEQWLPTIRFPYIGPEAKLRRVKDNYNRVEVGSTKQEVFNAFGPPDFEEELHPKEPNRPCLGYEFMYYFEKPEETTNEVKDKKIQVFFTRDGKASWIAGNVGLAEKGRP